MAKRSRKRSRRSLGQADSGTFMVPSSGPRIVGLSTTGKWVSGLIAAGLLAWLLWPKKASAEELATPTNTDSPAAAGSTTVSRDPGSGVAIVGNAGKLATSASYVVRPGDAGWSNLASRTYGDYRWWPALWDANRSATKFTNPDMLRVGDVIVLPSLPVGDAAFREKVFARAEADRKWQLAKAKAAKAGKKFTTPRPPSIFNATPVSAALLPAAGGSSQPTDQSLTASKTTSGSNVNAGSGTTTSTASPTSPTTITTTQPSTEEQLMSLEAEMQSSLNKR